MSKMRRRAGNAVLLMVSLALLAGLSGRARGVPPVCDADGMYAGTATEPITFDGTASYDPDGVIIDFQWDFGDSQYGAGAQPVHAYNYAGTYTVVLTVTDDGGEQTQCTTQAIIESQSPPPPPKTWSLTDYMNQAEAHLPTFGPDLLTVPDGPDWLGGMTVEQVAAAAGDIPPQIIIQDGPILMGYDLPDGPRYIKIDFDRGYVRYSNRERAYQAGSGCTAASDPIATSVFANVAGALALPFDEFGSELLNTVSERSITDGSPTEISCQIERMVTQERMTANGYPVLDSRARSAVSHYGDCARLVIEWPWFHLQSGLQMRTRAAVVEDLAQRIWLAESDSATALGPEVELQIRIAYAPTATGFMPVARATFVDVGGMDSGKIEDVPLASYLTDVQQQGTPMVLMLNARFDPARNIAMFELFLPMAVRARLAVLDVAGRQLGEVTNASYPTGWQRLEWNARDEAGHRLPAGIYFVRLNAEGYESVSKLLVIR